MEVTSILSTDVRDISLKMPSWFERFCGLEAYAISPSPKDKISSHSLGRDFQKESLKVKISSFIV